MNINLMKSCIIHTYIIIHINNCILVDPYSNWLTRCEIHPHPHLQWAVEEAARGSGLEEVGSDGHGLQRVVHVAHQPRDVGDLLDEAREGDGEVDGCCST